MILGFGREGQDSYLFLRKAFPEKVLGIADKKEIKEFDEKIQTALKEDKKLKLYFGKDYLAKIGDCDIILKTPGISPKELNSFQTERSRTPSKPLITSQTQIFFDNFKGKIIGITGTKGKGTTVSLIYNILQKAGLKAAIGGNIGAPVLQTLLQKNQPDFFVYELSSHQLQGLKKSSHIAVFLNFFPDHLDYYKTIGEYQRAKKAIFQFQTKNDFFIFNQDDATARIFSRKTKAKRIPFSLKQKKEILKIIQEKEIPLKGKFNFYNLLASLRVGECLGLKKEAIKEGIKIFQPLPHRLEFVGEFQSIEFYNDSMATIPESAIAALEGLGRKVKTLLVGGSDKGSNYQKMGKAIAQNQIKNLILLGQGTGKKIAGETKKFSQRLRQKPPLIFLAGSMPEAVKIAFEKTPAGGICLLSPGSASFNLFQSYQERGELFKKNIQQYAKTHS